MISTRTYPATLRFDNLLPATVFAFLLYMQVLRFSFPPALPNLLLALINTLCVILFLARRGATRSATPGETVLALSGTFVTAFLPEAYRETILSNAIQVVGLVAWTLSLVALGRSLGIAPADRGLKDRGAYALVRHPIYASELVFWLGFLLASPTLPTVIILCAWWGLQVMRMLREERIIDGYGEYRRRVRWRVVPGIW